MIKATLTILFLCLSVCAKTIDIKDYTTPNDGLNDRDGFQQAANDLAAAGGGTLIVSEGTWELQGDTVRFFSNHVAFKLVGDKGAVIRVSNPPTFAAMEVGNANSFELRDLVFIGGSGPVDTASVLSAHYTTQLVVKGCRFFGIYAREGLFNTSNVDAVYENNQFDGSGSDMSVIRAGGHGFRSLTVRNNTFFDYANFNGTYYSKPGWTPAWVGVYGEEDQVLNAAWGGTVVIENNRFDEAALTAVVIKNVRNVQIRNIAVNLNGSDLGRGVLFDNVKYGSIESSVFGYQKSPRPAIVLTNNSQAEVSKLDFGDGAYRGTFDKSSKFIVRGYCPPCEQNTVPAKAVSDSKSAVE